MPLIYSKFALLIVKCDSTVAKYIDTQLDDLAGFCVFCIDGSSQTF